MFDWDMSCFRRAASGNQAQDLEFLGFIRQIDEFALRQQARREVNFKVRTMCDLHQPGANLLLPIAAGIVVALVATPARADDSSGIATFGYIHSFVFEPQSSAGNGVEGTFVYYENHMPHGYLGFGGFTRVQNLTPGHLAFDIGPQANLGPVGLELGYAYRGPFEGNSGMHGVHVGPFASVGMVSLGVHAIVPIAASGAGKAQDTEFAVTLALKLFLPVFGEPYELRFGSGLPLREGPGADARVASSRPSSEWLDRIASADLQPPAAMPGESLRGWLAQRWLADALDEHAAVAAFARLSLALLGVGAPAFLVEATQRASLDEIRHAEICFTLARSYSNTAVGPGFLPGSLSPIELRSLEQIAVACLRDGCLGEGFAAALAHRASERAIDPPIRAAHAEIARDESAHAKLAWRIVEWCVAQGGAPVLIALIEAAERLPRLLDVAPVPADAALEEAADHGRFGVVEQMQIFLGVRRRVAERLAKVGTTTNLPG
jgi:hypothetical protein